MKLTQAPALLPAAQFAQACKALPLVSIVDAPGSSCARRLGARRAAPGGRPGDVSGA